MFKQFNGNIILFNARQTRSKACRHSMSRWLFKPPAHHEKQRRVITLHPYIYSRGIIVSAAGPGYINRNFDFLKVYSSSHGCCCPPALECLSFIQFPMYGRRCWWVRGQGESKEQWQDVDGSSEDLKEKTGKWNTRGDQHDEQRALTLSSIMQVAKYIIWITREIKNKLETLELIDPRLQSFCKTRQD